MNTNLANNLKYLRELFGYNQQEIAEFLKVDQSLISKFEKGERTISSDVINSLACLYGVKVEDLENSNVPAIQVSTSFRKGKLEPSDLEVISRINKISLNIDFLEDLLNGGNNA